MKYLIVTKNDLSGNVNSVQDCTGFRMLKRYLKKNKIKDSIISWGTTDGYTNSRSRCSSFNLNGEPKDMMEAKLGERVVFTRNKIKA